MKKLLPLLAVLMVTALLLSACGEPAYPAVSHDDHGETADHDHADAEDHADGEAHEADESAETEDHDMAAEEPADGEGEQAEESADSAVDDAGEEDEAAEETAEEESTETEVVEEEAAEESVEEPAEEAALVGDPAHGQELFNQMITEVSFACATCHRVDSDLQLIGPGLLGVAERAGERDPEATPEEYIHNSIISPDAYVVEGFSADLMPETYAEIFSEQEIADLVAYVMSLEG